MRQPWVSALFLATAAQMPLPWLIGNARRVDGGLSLVPEPYGPEADKLAVRPRARARP